MCSGIFTVWAIVFASIISLASNASFITVFGWAIAFVVALMIPTFLWGYVLEPKWWNKLPRKSQDGIRNGIGWIIGIIIIFNLSGNPPQTSKITEDEKGDIAEKIISDMQSRYGDLADVSVEMIQAMDEQCVWLSDNISESVGEYCGDATLENYAEINKASLAAIDYDDEDELEQMVEEIINQGNLSYNELLKTARESSDAINEECDWLYENISSGVGDFCKDINSKFESSNFRGDPFSSSDYSYLYNDSQN